ncbi:hypothetical protein SS50377_22575 [Spironucleus salmonicida]|uniref:Uncharacterized protein n=1 Tax=Spironucleus salmonicida TaxID=348837 RepID=V6LCF7_9EUKA|nr:hypothetical protein SS50377_22575 [Spironucleus salmonicida]|eukprot:EST41933.1 Hypothetical protein SS50377_18237 [Spironucleus salmonicida]
MPYYYNQGKFVPITPIRYELANDAAKYVDPTFQNSHTSNLQKIESHFQDKNWEARSAFLPFLVKKTLKLDHQKVIIEDDLASRKSLDQKATFKGWKKERINIARRQQIEMIGDDLTLSKPDRALVNSRNGDFAYMQKSFFPTLPVQQRRRRPHQVNLNTYFFSQTEKL